MIHTLYNDDWDAGVAGRTSSGVRLLESLTQSVPEADEGGPPASDKNLFIRRPILSVGRTSSVRLRPLRTKVYHSAIRLRLSASKFEVDGLEEILPSAVLVPPPLLGTLVFKE